MIADQFPGLLELSDEAKLQLASELLADVVGEAEESDPEIMALIDSRLAEYRANPERVSDWQEVKARLLHRDA